MLSEAVMYLMILCWGGRDFWTKFQPWHRVWLRFTMVSIITSRQVLQCLK